MLTGIRKGLTSVGVMAAVLFTGPAAMVVPTQVTAQVVAVSTAQPNNPALTAAPEVLPEPARGAPAPSSERTPQETTAPLRWITADAVFPAAPADNGAPYSGLLVAPKADGLLVYVSPGADAVGMIPARVIDSEGSDRTWMPAIGPIDGKWLQVLLPARRNLPSSGDPVNGATGWVLASDVLTKSSNVTVDVDLTARTITVADGAAVLDVFPVSISGGDETARGRSFVTGRYSTAISQNCSAQPMMALSAQSESVDGYIDQPTAVQAIHAFSEDCRSISGYTAATPGCIIANEWDIPRLLELVPDGTPVTVR
ncbi:hypothetical protein ASH00_09010 [Arthrobacter sp. Soil782]|uniref:L,D-transpeptidase n=1 Tax=Arthrobacter sp. Soil782 TaxID=1736410 RepID=UPI0006FB01A2|nr:L,D-transpeptidase [Arthrobacter sp. Soil782]KRF05596.1 hypothetical protein ASH00_09010 [Arthrobacter sp. Soil782]